jgi:hypothetical protein
VLVELLLQVVEQAVALRQVVQRGVGRIAQIALAVGPGLTGLVVLGDGDAGVMQFVDEGLEALLAGKAGFIERVTKRERVVMSAA